MTLATPIWLAAAAAVIVPILIHLFGRPRPRLRRFPSLMLLRKAQSRRGSTTRVRRLISLLLRALALMLLALVLAGPLSQWPPLASLGERLGVTAIVVDSSPSMSADVPAGRPISRAREAARVVLAALPPGEEVVVLAGDEEARSVAPEQAQQLLGATPVSNRRAFLAVDLARLLDGDRSLSRIFLLTDLQATSLGVLPSVAAGRAEVIAVDVGEDLPGNSALTGLGARSDVHLTDLPLELTARARSWGETPGRVPLTVDFGGGEATAGIDLLPDSTALASIEIPVQQAGVLTCVATVPAGSLSVDNRHVFTTEIRPRLRVAILGDEDRTRFMEAALDPWPAGDPRSVIEVTRPQVLDPEAALDAVILADADVGEETLAALTELARDGVGVLVFAPVDGGALEALGFSAVTLGEPARRPDGASLAEIEFARPPLAAFADPGSGDLTAARFSSVPAVTVSPDSDLTILARYDDGTPALLEGAVGRARTLVLATSSDDAWSDLVRMPEFVPLMHRLARYLAAGTAPTILAGAPGELSVAAVRAEPDTATVLGPDGSTGRADLADGTWRFEAPRVGAWRLRAAEEDIAALAVNLDSAESDPARLSPAEVRDRLRPLDAQVIGADALPSFLDRLRPGSAEISSLVALLALLVLAAESVQSLQSRARSDEQETQ